MRWWNCQISINADETQDMYEKLQLIYHILRITVQLEESIISDEKCRKQRLQLTKYCNSQKTWLGIQHLHLKTVVSNNILMLIFVYFQVVKVIYRKFQEQKYFLIKIINLISQRHLHNYEKLSHNAYIVN